MQQRYILHEWGTKEKNCMILFSYVLRISGSVLEYKCKCPKFLTKYW